MTDYDAIIVGAGHATDRAAERLRSLSDPIGRAILLEPTP